MSPRLRNTVMAGEGRPSTSFLADLGEGVDRGAKPRHDEVRVHQLILL